MKSYRPVFLRASQALPVAAIVAGLVCGALSLLVFGPADVPSPESDEWYVRGNHFAAEHRLDDAIEAFQHAMRLNPQKADPYFALGMLWLQKEDWRSAEASFSDFVKRSPNNGDGWLLLGRCRDHLGNAPGAREAYIRALTLNPSLQEARAALQRLRGD